MPSRTLNSQIGALQQRVAETAQFGSHAPTLWELAEEYPALVRVASNAAEPHESYAVVTVRWSPDVPRLMRNCKGAFWMLEKKAWRVPAHSARQLSEALYAITQRSR
jgi:hypothetical protein